MTFSYHLLRALLLVVTASSAAQQAEISLPQDRGFGYVLKYDPNSDSLIAHSSGAPAGFAQFLSMKSTGWGKPTYLATDFPQATEISINDIGTSRNKQVYVSANLKFNGSKPQHVILVYGSDNRLNAVWDVFPYHHHKIVVDEKGGVWGFGHRIGYPHHSYDDDYPLLVRYDPNGRVDKEAIGWKALQPTGPEVLYADASSGPHWMTMRRSSPILYIATVRRIVMATPMGEALKQIDLAPVLDSLQKEFDADELEVAGLVARDDDFVLRVIGRRGVGLSVFATLRFRNVDDWSLLEKKEASRVDSLLLGKNRAGKIVQMKRGKPDSGILSIE